MQVHDNLVARITSKAWKPGQMIPSEHDLASDLGVSTGTVRKALALMREGQLVERRQGVGTFVVDQEIDGPTIRFSNFCDTEGVCHNGVIEQRDISVDLCSEDEQAILHLSPSEKCIRISQMRTLNDEKFMSELVSWPLSQIEGVDLGGNNLPQRIVILAQRFGFVLDRAVEDVAIRPASDLAAEHLGVQQGEPMFYVDKVIISSNGAPVEWRRAFCRQSGSWRYRVEMR